MSKCSNCDKPKANCSGNTLYAPCVYWEVNEDLQDFVSGGSSTEPTECVTLDDALIDIYEKLRDLEELTDFSEFESDCLELDDEPTLQTVIAAMDEKVCEHEEAIEDLTMCNLLDEEIGDCIDVDCLAALEDACENPLGITTYKELLVSMAKKICELSAA